MASESYRENIGGRYWPRLEQIVFAEEELVGLSAPLIDIAFFCCDGKAGFAVVTVGEKTDAERIAHYTPDGQRITSVMREPGYERDWLPPDFRLPARFAEAARAAEALSAGIDFVRVDIMSADDRLYACEMTPFPGLGAYDRTDFIRNWARSWDIGSAWFMTHHHNPLLERYRKALKRQASRSAVSTARRPASPV